MTVYVVTNATGKPSTDGGHVFPYISVSRDGVERAAGMDLEMAEKIAGMGFGEALPLPQGVTFWPFPNEDNDLDSVRPTTTLRK